MAYSRYKSARAAGSSFSPLRPFEDGRIPYGNAPDSVPFIDRFDRDFEDVFDSDAILFNMIGAKMKSVGTTCEVAWSYTRLIPTALVIDKGNVNDNIFLLRCVTANPKAVVVTTLLEGVNFIRSSFGLPVYGD